MPDYKDTANARGIFRPKLPAGCNTWEQARRKNNPEGKPVGHFTGRCRYCGSNNLWGDNLAYGCNACGAMLG